MKISTKKFVFSVFSFFVIFAIIENSKVFAQIGGGVFARLGKKPAAKKPAAAKNTKGKTPPAKSGKNTVKTQPTKTEDFIDYSILTYKSDTRLNTAQKLVNEFAQTSDERTLILTLFNAAKSGYDEEAAKKGKKMMWLWL